MPAENSAPPARPSRLWLWVVAAFVLQLTAWAVWLVIASRSKVEEIPVVKTSDRR